MTKRTFRGIQHWVDVDWSHEFGPASQVVGVIERTRMPPVVQTSRLRASGWGLGAPCLLVALSLAACSDSDPIESEFPAVEVIMDTTEFARQPIVGVATVEFLVANFGPGMAYFEGCPDPIRIVVEWFDPDEVQWETHDVLNSCDVADTPAEEQLEVEQAYEYSFEEGQVGLYQFRVTYGEESDIRDQYFVTSPAYAIK